MYILNNKFNTDPNYDYGAFQQLATRLSKATLNIKNFMTNFVKEGTYVFADYNAPNTPNTIIFVTTAEKKESICEGRTQWPLTPTNLLKFGIQKRPT